MIMRANRLTIITPTYNRLNTLPRLYKSLAEQTDREFQWILIDDGSTDGTKEWAEHNLQGIDWCEYHFQANQGKHIALNHSHKYIKGDYVLVVDSDDVLKNDCVETVLKYWDKYDENDDIVGVVFQRGSSNGKAFDETFQGEKVCSIFEMTNNGMHGDHCETVRTSEFIKYPFPQFEDEKFMGEAWLWINIGQDGNYVYANKIVYTCEYLEGGLSQSGRKLRLNNPRGGMEHAKVMMQEGFKLSIRIKNSILLCAYSMVANVTREELIKNTPYGLLVKTMYPAGGLLALYWKWRYYR